MLAIGKVLCKGHERYKYDYRKLTILKGVGTVKVVTRLPLSLVIITLNEERNIERCIRSVPFASEVLIVDSFSTDRTRDIASDLGARVLQEKWRGYGPQKAWATEHAKYDWILNLDADEALSQSAAEEILEKFSKLNPEVGYLFPRLSYHLFRWIKHGGWHPDYQLRLFNRQKSHWSMDQVHERVMASQTEKFKNSILHWVFVNFAEQVETNNHYSSIQANETTAKGIKFNFAKLIFKPFSKFIETYFLKLGFLDGFAGFVISISAAYSVFIRWVKVWENSKSAK